MSAGTLGRIVSAPFHKVMFRDFFIGDQLTSLILVVIDIFNMFCFYTLDAWTGALTNDICACELLLVFP